MRLPKSVQEIADVIGRERALYLVGQLPRCVMRDRRYPNAESTHLLLYVPTLKRLTLQHELVRILGLNDAEKMCRHFGGEILKPASCELIYKNYRNKVIHRFIEDGMKAAQIAAILCMDAQYVRQVIRDMKNPQQDSLVAANDNAPIKRKARAANEQSRRE